ncbi:hypothetical protein HDU76_005924, partial [Blyttiomyces sp. JEL0837]
LINQGVRLPTRRMSITKPPGGGGATGASSNSNSGNNVGVGDEDEDGRRGTSMDTDAYYDDNDRELVDGHHHLAEEDDDGNGGSYHHHHGVDGVDRVEQEATGSSSSGSGRRGVDRGLVDGKYY